MIPCAITFTDHGGDLRLIPRVMRPGIVESCIIGLLLGSPISFFTPQRQRKIRYDAVVAFSPSDATLDGRTCVITGTMRADEFFAGLQRVDTANGEEFRKGPERVNYFPRQLSLRIAIAGMPRPGEQPEYLEMGSPLNAGLMNSLRFQAHWKRGMQMRPVKSTLLVGHFMQPNNVWVYELTVNSDPAPLSDNLIVTITSKDGHIVCRLSAAL